MLLRMVKDLATPSAPASSQDEVPFSASAGEQEAREQAGQGEREPPQNGQTAQG